MRYFTSDLHFGDTRLEILGRNLIVDSSEEMDEMIITNWNNEITNDDTVYVIGDIALNIEELDKVKFLNGNKILVRGNYDQQFSLECLQQYFSEIYDQLELYIGNEKVFVNHYPEHGKPNMMNICGHIHGLWKIQRNMINVSLDAWHIKPVSEDMIKFQMNGIRKHYDGNVFIGENKINKK